MTFYPEILTSTQQKVLHRIGALLSKQGWYLGGGTALALLLGHRKSVDLDWFTADKVKDSQKIGHWLNDENINIVVKSAERGTLHGTIQRVRISLFEYRYPLLQQLIYWPEAGCDLASLDDLACMKLSAVAQRGSRKDFIDIYALVQKHRPLGELLGLYQKKYDVNTIAPLLYGLSYFEDADRERNPQMIWNVSWREVKRFIQESVRNFMQDLS